MLSIAMSTHLIIPARLNSTRLPNKPLLLIHNKPMILWTAQRASQAVTAGVADSYYVATDDCSIYELCQANRVPVLMTQPNHMSGTDRLAEVARLLTLFDTDVVINMQGDEPLIPPMLLLQVKELLACHTDCVMATLCEPICRYEDFVSDSVVKVVAAEYKALYFSRSPIPYRQDKPLCFNNAYRHLGVYAYRAGLLREFSTWSMGVLERIERLEQLRVLENNQSIAIDIAKKSLPLGVDTKADLDRLNAMTQDTLEQYSL